MALKIIEPGLASTIQDEGRPGYFKVGIPEGGSLDRYSATLANRLVGNTRAEAVIEAAYMGPKFTTDADAVVAVAGAPIDVFVNGELQEPYTRITLEAGDEVSFGYIKGGSRFYIAVAGGIDVPKMLGSRSTYVIGSLGGIEGRAIQAGDNLPVGDARSELPLIETIAEADRPAFENQVEVRVILGLYHQNLDEEGAKNLVEGTWKLTPVADRMGMRYDGPGVSWREREAPFGAGQDPSNIVDAAYPVGSIQIPGGTQPIVLHRDAVSGGGYAMVATVISADMDLVARSAPGTETKFVPVTMDEALAAREERNLMFDKIWS